MLFAKSRCGGEYGGCDEPPCRNFGNGASSCAQAVGNMGKTGWCGTLGAVICIGCECATYGSFCGQ